jgi:hypothetical protein
MLLQVIDPVGIGLCRARARLNHSADGWLRPPAQPVFTLLTGVEFDQFCRAGSAVLLIIVA